jgi:porphobilinogen synthase
VPARLTDTIFNFNNMTETFPRTRLRRNRQNSWIRELNSQINIAPSDLILPVFVIEGKDKEEKISGLPDVSRFSIDGIVISSS